MPPTVLLLCVLVLAVPRFSVQLKPQYSVESFVIEAAVITMKRKKTTILQLISI
jgi:hypothetical protein